MHQRDEASSSRYVVGVVPALASAFVLVGCGLIAEQPATSQGDEGGTDTDGSIPPIAIVDAATPPAPSDAGAEVVLPAGGLDGKCIPGDVTLGYYDPDCVYALGTTVPGSQGHDVLFDPGAPSRVVSGFGYFQTDPTIRASDRRVVFTSSFPGVAYVFSPGLPNEGEKAQYARHTVLPTPGCTQMDLRRTLLYPDTVGGVYECTQLGPRYYVLGTSTTFDTVGTKRYVLALGANGAALVRTIGGALSVLDGAGASIDVMGIEPDKVIAARSRSTGGFFVAAVTSSNTHSPRLYELGLDGVAQQVGAYNMRDIQLRAETVLEPSGAMIAMVTLEAPFADGIVRLGIGTAPEVLFDERMHAVQIHAGKLVTGP